MPLLFTYGTLRLADVQLATFGRLVRGETDEALGCECVIVAIDDPQVMADTGRGEHRNLRFNGSKESRLGGTVLELSDAELAEADKYEKLSHYKRREVQLASGRTAWAYVYSPD
jgi:gamma-glutamylcyclotransferase (GGCT)/AIG2-like uncharacterized protein YtfP